MSTIEINDPTFEKDTIDPLVKIRIMNESMGIAVNSKYKIIPKHMPSFSTTNKMLDELFKEEITEREINHLLIRLLYLRHERKSLSKEEVKEAVSAEKESDRFLLIKLT